MINEAVYVLREMSADARAQELARQREKVLHDEASYLETARLQGREELLAQLRVLGADENIDFTFCIDCIKLMIDDYSDKLEKAEKSKFTQDDE